MSTWFTSDQHYFHAAIIRYCGRPYRDVREMNSALSRAHNELVAPDDVVYLLGDLAFGDPRSVLRMLGSALNGRLRLVPGNHDACHPMAYDSDSVVQICAQSGIEVLPPETEIELAGQAVLLNHFPPEGDSGRRDRYLQWRPDAHTDRGKARWIVHGHVHEVWRQRGRWINVGVDAWAGQPVHEEEVARLIDSGPQLRERLDWR